MTGAALSFDPATHEYRRPDGARVPSVTQILRGVGVSADWDLLRGRGLREAAAIDRKREIGTALHADAAAYDDGDLDLASVHPDVLPFLEAWAMCRKNLALVPVMRERRLYSEKFGFCGTCDAVCYRGADLERLYLIELKCGSAEDAGARYQTVGYQMLWETEYPARPIAERWAVELTPGAAVPYRVVNYSAAPDALEDRLYWAAFVMTYRKQAARRGEA